AVFEEKNGYDDSPFSPFLEDIQKVAFGSHPYSRPILGYTEHLKNPQLSKLYEFFDTYYVANNMTLILVGDLDIEQTKILVQDCFSLLRSGTLPQVTFPDLPEWKGHVVINSRKTPVGVGVIGYRGVPADHPDAAKIELLSSLFSNDSKTGLLDKLATDHKLYQSFIYPYSMRDHGVIAFGYIPKIIIQPHRSAAKYVMAAIDSVRTGNFSDIFFNAIKMDYLKQHTKSMETISEKAYSLLQCELDGRSWESYLNDLQVIENMSKADLVALAQKYLTENYLDYRSHIGFPKKKKMEKPDWKPIPQHNGNQQSIFAQELEKLTVEAVVSQKIDFQKDVSILKDFLPYPDIYAVKNPTNDIFQLDIRYEYGELDDPKCSVLADYFDLQGTENLAHQEFALQLQALGATLSMQTSSIYTNVHIEGFDKYFDSIMNLCLTKLIHPGNDEKQFKTIKLSLFTDKFMNKNDAATYGQAAIQYAAFQDKSYFLRSLKYRDVKHLKGADLWNILAEIRQHQATVYFSGNIETEQILQAWSRNFPELVDYTPIRRPEPVLPFKKYDTTSIFIVSNPKFIQSNIYFYSVSDSLYNEKEKAGIELFNQYFGRDMSSLVFQEIRELKALAYNASGGYRYDERHRTPAYLLCFIGTQTDKTVDAIEAMRHLIDSMPLIEEKFNTARLALKERNEAQYIHFRSIPLTVNNWIKTGYQEDPRPMRLQLMKNISIDEMNAFYQSHIQSKPVVITLSGNKKRFNLKVLSKMGKVQMLKKREIF
ncbi:MAG: insulinase family protein, partial [Bacteroidales bacterium]|nr:insulinase family protein [Bacteroidales bacterium]